MPYSVVYRVAIYYVELFKNVGIYERFYYAQLIYLFVSSCRDKDGPIVNRVNMSVTLILQWLIQFRFC